MIESVVIFTDCSVFLLRWFCKTCFCTVVGSRGFGTLPNKLKCRAFYGKGTPFLCLLRNFIFEKDGKGMEGQRIIKDGHIVVKNPLYQELPKHEVVMKSGKTFYRFTGSYDGERSLPHKVLRLMEQEKGKKEVE